MTTLLEIRDLEIRFQGVAAVKGLSFSVGAAECVALVGESGCGKSVTALSILRLLPASVTVSGRILFQGEDLLTRPHREMRALRGRSISMIFQEPMTSLNPVMTIGRQIGEAIRRHQALSARAVKARVIELLDLVRIPEPHRRLSDFPHQLSGGMRQRVMIAIAVACGPQLLIADEPTTALDVTIQAQILDLLDCLRRDLSMSVVLITHDLGLVAQWASRIVVMYAGRKVEEAKTHALFERPLHPYTIGLLRASPRLDRALHYRQGRLSEIPGTIALAAYEAGCAFAPRCSLAHSKCRMEPPELLPAGDGRLVACPVTVKAKKSVYDAVG